MGITISRNFREEGELGSNSRHLSWVTTAAADGEGEQNEMGRRVAPEATEHVLHSSWVIAAATKEQDAQRFEQHQDSRTAAPDG